MNHQHFWLQAPLGFGVGVHTLGGRGMAHVLEQYDVFEAIKTFLYPTNPGLRSLAALALTEKDWVGQ